MNLLELVTLYLPPRFVQTVVLLVVFALLFGPERLAGWIEALGATAALRLLGIEAG